MFEPTIIYKKGGQLRGPYKTTYSEKGVNTQEEFDLSIKDGWFDNLDEAVNPFAEAKRKEKGDSYILGNVALRRKEDYKKKPKPKKEKAKPKSMKEKTREAIEANKKTDELD